MENQNNESEYNQEHKKKNLLKNPWKVSTIIFVVTTLLLLIFSFSGVINEKVTGNVISSGGGDSEKISILIDCLADNEVKIYGANWCGWTKKFVVETLGGFDIVAPIYVECTEKEAECSAEGVSGYPTTKINGKVYSGSRTFEGLAQATGCQAPNIEGLAQEPASTGSASGGCGV